MESLKENIKRLDPFVLYSLLCPFLAVGGMILNNNFGISCADACIEHMENASNIIHSLILFTFILLFFINVYFYKKYKYLHKKIRVCLIMAILNCICCSYFFLGTINYLAAAIYIGIPMMIIIPIQYFLWWYILFCEVLNKKGKYGIFIGLGFIGLLYFLKAIENIFF